MERQRPWVRLKTASSLDGRTGLNNGQSQWITSPAAREDTHRWRARACAILSGAGTICHDDPLLNVRHIPVSRQPLRVILDSHFRIPIQARIFEHAEHNVLLVSANDNQSRRQQLQAKGIEVFNLPFKRGVRSTYLRSSKFSANEALTNYMLKQAPH